VSSIWALATLKHYDGDRDDDDDVSLLTFPVISQVNPWDEVLAGIKRLTSV
jgi:hypothetical protein